MGAASPQTMAELTGGLDAFARERGWRWSLRLDVGIDAFWTAYVKFTGPRHGTGRGATALEAARDAARRAIEAAAK